MDTSLFWFLHTWLKYWLLRAAHTLFLGFLFVTMTSLGFIYQNTIESTGPQGAQIKPSWTARKSGKIWSHVGKQLVHQAQNERDHLKVLFLETRKELQIKGDLPGIKEAGMTFQGTYGRLPEVFVDLSSGAIFPAPVTAPDRSSWYHTTLLALRFLDLLHSTRSELQQMRLLSSPAKTTRFENVTNQWNQLNTEFEKLTEKVRYLEAWLPSLESELDREQRQNRLPRSVSLVQAFFNPESDLFRTLPELMKPHRVVKPSFLPDDLSDVPAGVIVIPIATDISDRRFLSEVEDAVELHWNRSSWAKSLEISFHIRWNRVPQNPRLARGQGSLKEHLLRFPKNHAILTTGALNTHVVAHAQNFALVLGPGRITPRTLAHEIGHLMGFSDCYVRTLSSQGIFGLVVLEWDNPYYPDDLMCDNSYGEPRVGSW